MSVRSVVAAGLAVAVLTACTPATPETPGTAPAPVYTCTPPAGPATPHVCSKESYDKQQAQLALEAEALQVYDRYATEYWRLAFAGGSATSTPDLDATLADPLKKDMLALLSYQKQNSQVARGAAVDRRATIDRNAIADGSEVAVMTCEDSRQSAMYGPDGTKVGDGLLIVGTRYLKHIDGKLRIFDDSTKEQDACPV